jgi:DNA-binding transcriptional ArsR family regulator
MVNTPPVMMKQQQHPVLTDEALHMVASRFRVLGDPNRLRILNHLMQGEFSVQQLVESTGLSQPNISRHLSVLRSEGIVQRRPEGNHAFYSIQDPTIMQLCEIVCDRLLGNLLQNLGSLPNTSS